MSSKRLVWIAISAIFLTFAIFFSKPITRDILNFSNSFKSKIIKQKKRLYNLINTHYQQAIKIEKLQAQVRSLQKQASLSVAYASKLNALLSDLNISAYQPDLHLVEVLSYEKLGNSDRVYLDFKEFDEDREYGLIYKGYVAGVVKSKFSQPLGIFFSQKDALCSVLIGEDLIEGVAVGNGATIKIEYIPSYKNPKIGDEVVTSGYDKLFYYGIKVGKIIKIEQNDMYKIAIVKPYVTLKHPTFLYAVDVK